MASSLGTAREELAQKNLGSMNELEDKERQQVGSVVRGQSEVCLSPHAT
jgi:hypothetical protein